MFIIQLPNVRVRLWHLWVKRRKRGRSGKLGGKSWLCFRTAEEGNVAVFSISVYPSLNNFRISAFSKVRYLNESRMNGREKEWSTPKTTFQCLKGSMELGLVRARRSLALLHSEFYFYFGRHHAAAERQDNWPLTLHQAFSVSKTTTVICLKSTATSPQNPVGPGH